MRMRATNVNCEQIETPSSVIVSIECTKIYVRHAVGMFVCFYKTSIYIIFSFRFIPLHCVYLLDGMALALAPIMYYIVDDYLYT